MKILLIKKDIVDNETLNKGIALVKVEALKIGLTLDFTIKETTQTFSSMPDGHGHTIVSPTQIFQEGVRQGYVFEEDALVCLVYDWTKVIPRPTNPHMGGLSMQIPVQFYLTFDSVFMQFFLHELSHYYLLKNGAPDLTHNYSPEFGQKPRHEWYLHLIKPYVKQSPITPPVVVPPVVPPVKGYRHFSERESKNMTTEFMLFADELRHRLGWSLADSSPRGSFRTPAENKLAGGVSNSAHLKGKAKDWRIIEGAKKYQFIEEAQKLAKEKGKIIGIGAGDNFCHLDVGHRTENTVWNYRQLKD